MLKSGSPHRVAWPIALTLVALIIAATIVVVFLRLESWPARTARQSTAELERLGQKLGAALVHIAHFQPGVTNNERGFLGKTPPGSELGVLSRGVEDEKQM